MRIFVCGVLLITLACHQGPVNLDRHFKGFDGAFILHNLQTGETTRHNPERCRRRFAPYSTFKLPHSLIGLQTGVLTGPDHLRKYDPVKYPTTLKGWRKDHTLASAIRVSALWYFRETAKEIERRPMQSWVNLLEYGNRSVAGDLDLFWLGQGLSISAEEQIAFLTDLHNETLPIDKAHQQALKEMMVLELGDNYVLRGKTGSDGEGFGWLVGWLERGDDVFIFAYNADLPKGKQGPSKRKDLVKDLLREMQLIPLITPVAFKAQLD